MVKKKQKITPLPLQFGITRVELSSMNYAIWTEEVNRVLDFICLQWLCFCSISYKVAHLIISVS